MNPFCYIRSEDPAAAIRQVASDPRTEFLAGGTSLLDLMKLGVEAPTTLVDINHLPMSRIEVQGSGVRIGALVTNSDLAYHEVVRKRYPVLSQAILSGASPQLRNMATVAGNLMQRTRCPYFRDGLSPCNKRVPGAGCAALDGFNRSHAVLGTSDKCIASNPSDMCVALAILDAVVHVVGEKGERTIPFNELHVLPGDTPERETVLEHGELITAIELPSAPFAARSHYLKVQDRANYEFALASVAVALEVQDGIIRTARLALGGVATKPWRAFAAEHTLVGARPGEAAYAVAAQEALKDAKGRQFNAFKIELARRTIVRALTIAGEMPWNDRAIGSAIDRVDSRLKVTGAARYATDASVAGVTHGVIVPSRIARGRVKTIDVDAARKAPGVVAVVTHENMPKLNEITTNFFTGGKLNESRLPLADDGIYYAGQYLAVVVADTPARARYAASLVEVAYDEEQPRAVREDVPEVEVEKPELDFFRRELQHRRGDVDKALTTEGLVRVDETYTTPVHTHNPLEMSGTVAHWDGDRLTLHDATQWVQGTRAILAEAFGVPRENVRVLCPFLGGGFGGKAFTHPHTILAAAAAKVAGRPVKLPLTRAQMFTGVGHRPSTEQKLTVAATKDGTLTAIRHVTTQDASLVGEHMESCGMTTSQIMYACPNVQIVQGLARINVATPTTMRGPGEIPGTFALESALDELAYALRMDPVELRVRNHTAVNPTTSLPWSSNYLKECYALGAEKFGWQRRTPQPRSMRDGNLLVGWGVATATKPGIRLPASARVRLSVDGQALVTSAGHELGNGSYTVYTQAAADALGLPVAKVTFELGDSILPDAPVAGASNSTASITEAVIAAAAVTMAKLARLAVADAGSPLFGLREDQVAMHDGRLFATEEPSRGEPFAAALQRGGMAVLEGEASVKLSDEKLASFAFQSFGAQFCEVKVDDWLGRVRVTRWVGAYDNGRVLNPKTSHSQVVGGIIMGIGAALMEDAVYDRRTARPVTDNLTDYVVPVHADTPEIEAYFVDRPDPHINTLGCRGIGELSMTGVAAAVANAVYHATGKRVRSLPITPDKLL